MQVAAEAPPLLLASRHQPFARSLKVCREPRRMDGNADLPGEIVEKAPVGGRERLVPGAVA
jgi:hypothetical protein